MNDWSPSSWSMYTQRQAVRYPDEAALNHVLKQLSNHPPLVTSGEIHALKKAIACAGRGEAFILQGGDCAESFDDCRSEMIANKLKILLQMSVVLFHGMKKPIVRIGRIAGQYAKPRSSEYETKEDKTLPSYRGDLINAQAFNSPARTPDPALLLQGYSYSAMTLNFIRALIDGGFADWHHPQQWDLRFVQHSSNAEEYHTLVCAIADELDSLALDPRQNSLNTDFFTSHEALHLHYEQSLTRRLQDGHWYALSTHLPWLGLRTGTLDSAHLEFLRGIQNPIGIKVGPKATPSWLLALLNRVNPNQEEGRILLISRLGINHVSTVLPPLIEAIKTHNIPVTWSCDPMHGNTEITHEGIKTRHFDTILNELKQTLVIHHQMQSHLGGVHFELTGENVTECVGGACGLTANDLKTAYHSLVDPRLNYEQSLEMAIQLSCQFKALG